MKPKPVGAAGSAAVRDLISGAVRPAKVLGAFRTALYLRLHGGEVIAVLSQDAVRLPIGLVLPTSGTAGPLTRLDGEILVGSSVVRIGDWSIRISRLVSARAPIGLAPNDAAIERASGRLKSIGFTEHDPGLIDALARDPQCRQVAADLAPRLLGAGSGLTPSGDDLLAGFLVGAWSCGLAADPLRAVVLAAAPPRTTDLSAALLRCACRGESIPQVSAMLSALSGLSTQNAQLDDALAELIRVGHTSGLALATGVVAAAKAAVRRHRQNAATLSPAAAGECSQRDGSRR